MMARFCRTGIALLSLVTLFAGSASAERRRPSQIVPTGAEDAVTVSEDEGTRNTDALTSESADGLTVVQRADGTQGIDLQGRFQHVLRAGTTPDGKTEYACSPDVKLTDANGKVLKPWAPKRGSKVMRLNVKPFKAPIVVQKAPALEVK